MFAWLRRSRTAPALAIPARPVPARPSAVRISLESLEQRETPCGFGLRHAAFGFSHAGFGHTHSAPSSGHHGDCRGGETRGHHGRYGHNGHHSRQHTGHCGGPQTPPPTTTTTSLSGTVLTDHNGDGTADSPVAGLTVELFDANGTVVATTTTAADGSYRFAGFAAGTYSVRLSSGETVIGSVGFIDGSGDGTAGGATTSGIEVGAGQNGTNYNFVIVLPQV